MMNKAAHDRYTFYYGCWGANVKVATFADEKKDRYGFSLIHGDSSIEHGLSKNAYYIAKVKIPTVIPAGDCVLGWAWYGGTSGGDAKATNVDSKPGSNAFFDLWLSCAFVKIKGGTLANSITPVFVNDFSQFTPCGSQGCAASVNTWDGCTAEPKCQSLGKAAFIKPKPFERGYSSALTPDMYGDSVPVSPVSSSGAPFGTYKETNDPLCPNTNTDKFSC